MACAAAQSMFAWLSATPVSSAMIAKVGAAASDNQRASVPNPKFAAFCGWLFCELRIRKGTRNL